MQYVKLWTGLAVVMLLSFGVLGYYGVQIYREKPPIPERVIGPEGQVLMTREDIQTGQNVWQSMGGMQVGSIWGHGAYVAPDWSADWLHRECELILHDWSTADYGTTYDQLAAEQKAALRSRLESIMRRNSYDAETDIITLTPARAKAFQALTGYYDALFGAATTFPDAVAGFSDGGMDPVELRDAYAIPDDSIPDAKRRRQMSAFFFWTAWSCVTNRPEIDAAAAAGDDKVVPLSYTSNWPPETLVGNRPTGSIMLWSILSVIFLLAGIAALSWYYVAQMHKNPHNPAEDVTPSTDPLLNLKPTPSMRAAMMYFWTVTALIVVQVGLGAVTAHYGVEGQGFYGIPLSEWLPYSVTRTWHTQLGIFWIATAWLATGLFIAPAVSGYEPKFQRLGVHILHLALVIIVLGTMFGTWYATRQKMGLEMNFWFGHQGYEYVDLGRFWQIFLLAGLFIWLGLMTRAIWPAFKEPGANRHLLALFMIASLAIGLFYAAGMMWGQHTHLAMAEYWRWWVVHLWVEGFFEVFATVVIAFLFVRLGLLRLVTATAAVIFSCTIFLSGGIIGTFHHLYFSGTPTAVLALGSVFSALEVVPLALVGWEAYENLSLSKKRPWVRHYRWPIYFFVAVSFWNLVGAGLFGFMINPPIALYYMQGLNTTPVHAHTALFGVYGMLGIGLMLFCFRGMTVRKEWKTGVLKFAFWSINIGLAAMVLISVLPVGLMQTIASVNHGMWYARSAEFLQTDLMATLRWLRAIGDTIFAIGIMALGWWILGLYTGWSLVPGVDRSLSLENDVNPDGQ